MMPATAASPAIRPLTRVVVLDWTPAEMLLSLGIEPIGAPEIADYRRWVGMPAMAGATADIGLRAAPNMEAIEQLEPDLIVTTRGFQPTEEILAKIAPTLSLAIYTATGQPYANATAELLRLAKMLDRVADAEKLTGAATASIAAGNALLATTGKRPVYVTCFIDQRRVMIFGANSLYHDVISRLGLRNAWMKRCDQWGSAIVGIEQLDATDATLVCIGPVDAGLRKSLLLNPVWLSLPVVRAGRVLSIPPVWAFGSLFSAARFADLLVHALIEGGR